MDRLRQAKAAAMDRLPATSRAAASNSSSSVSSSNQTHARSKTDRRKQSRVFGAPIDPLSNEIPAILEACITYLDLSGLEQEGLFRISGNAQLVAELQKRFDQGELVDLSEIRDPHVVANLLKRWFRELPEPLLTFDLYDMFIAAMTIPDIPARVVQLKKVLSALPRGNRVVLMILMLFLRRVAARSAKNMMGPDNIAIVFAPNLLKYHDQEDIGVTLADTPWANKTLAFFLSHYEDLFVSLESDLRETQGEVAPEPGTAAFALGEASSASVSVTFSRGDENSDSLDDVSDVASASHDGDFSSGSASSSSKGKGRARNMALATMRKGRQAAAASKEKGRQAAAASKQKAALAREKAIKQYQKRTHSSPGVKRQSDAAGSDSIDESGDGPNPSPANRSSGVSLGGDELPSKPITSLSEPGVPSSQTDVPSSATVAYSSNDVRSDYDSSSPASSPSTSVADDTPSSSSASSTPSALAPPERRPKVPKPSQERRMALRFDGPPDSLAASAEVDARAVEYRSRPLPKPGARSNSVGERPALPPKAKSSAEVARGNGATVPAPTKGLPKWPPES